MQTKTLLLATSLFGLAMATANAAAPTEILTKNACLACHGVANKIVGPGYNEVAAKYSGQADAADTLAKHIKEGGVGVWGQIPMPAQPNLSDADLKTIVDWLVSGAQP
ncbi:MAG: c-type cytochrome [Dechloromonas sp.]|jgi:cytochrome c|nr:c-type cytochrome [Xanthomonadales bacterium]TXI72816.1 MAG: c-type cytochrome [Dechloromonas sp.]HRD72512.1 c-type cytochrome [Aquimonas sp.]